jgi:tetratricopeptide (TPR) repeat protein
MSTVNYSQSPFFKALFGSQKTFYGLSETEVAQLLSDCEANIIKVSKSLHVALLIDADKRQKFFIDVLKKSVTLSEFESFREESNRNSTEVFNKLKSLLNGEFSLFEKTIVDQAEKTRKDIISEGERTRDALTQIGADLKKQFAESAVELFLKFSDKNDQSLEDIHKSIVQGLAAQAQSISEIKSELAEIKDIVQFFEKVNAQRIGVLNSQLSKIESAIGDVGAAVKGVSGLVVERADDIKTDLQTIKEQLKRIQIIDERLTKFENALGITNKTNIEFKVRDTFEAPRSKSEEQKDYSKRDTDTTSITSDSISSNLADIDFDAFIAETEKRLENIGKFDFADSDFKKAIKSKIATNDDFKKEISEISQSLEAIKDKQAKSECPFCGAIGSIDLETSKCEVCGKNAEEAAPGEIAMWRQKQTGVFKKRGQEWIICFGEEATSGVMIIPNEVRRERIIKIESASLVGEAKAKITALVLNPYIKTIGKRSGNPQPFSDCFNLKTLVVPTENKVFESMYRTGYDSSLRHVKKVFFSRRINYKAIKKDGTLVWIS